MKVIKRSGDIVAFDENKIINAINKAFIEVDGELYEDETSKDIAAKIKKLNEKRDLTVEEIQDIVETELMESTRTDVAKAYIRFRYKQEIARERKTDILNAVRTKLKGEKIENQNANMDENSFGGRVGEASSVVTKSLALEDIISKMAKDNHINNEIYIHDLDNYYIGTHNCLSIPFDDLLAKGFNTRQTDVRPAGSVNTAM